MIEMSIKKLVQYGRTTGLIEAEDEIYARNQILEVLKMSEYEEPGEITDEISLEDTLNALTDYAAEQGILENNSVVYRDLFDTRLMNCLMPRPSEVVKKFHGEYEKSPGGRNGLFLQTEPGLRLYPPLPCLQGLEVDHKDGVRRLGHHGKPLKA